LSDLLAQNELFVGRRVRCVSDLACRLFAPSNDVGLLRSEEKAHVSVVTSPPTSPGHMLGMNVQPFSGDNETVLMRGLQNLLATEGFHGINRGGAAGGKKAGDSGCGEEQQCCVEEDQRVACANFGPVRHKLCGVEAE
jgi:hypothetical protein